MRRRAARRRRSASCRRETVRLSPPSASRSPALPADRHHAQPVASTRRDVGKDQAGALQLLAASTDKTGCAEGVLTSRRLTEKPNEILSYPLTRTGNEREGHPFADAFTAERSLSARGSAGPAMDTQGPLRQTPPRFHRAGAGGNAVRARKVRVPVRRHPAQWRAAIAMRRQLPACRGTRTAFGARIPLRLRPQPCRAPARCRTGPAAQLASRSRLGLVPAPRRCTPPAAGRARRTPASGVETLPRTPGDVGNRATSSDSVGKRGAETSKTAALSSAVGGTRDGRPRPRDWVRGFHPSRRGDEGIIPRRRSARHPEGQDVLAVRGPIRRAGGILRSSTGLMIVPSTPQPCGARPSRRCGRARGRPDGRRRCLPLQTLRPLAHKNARESAVTKVPTRPRSGDG